MFYQMNSLALTHGGYYVSSGFVKRRIQELEFLEAPQQVHAYDKGKPVSTALTRTAHLYSDATSAAGVSGFPSCAYSSCHLSPSTVANAHQAVSYYYTLTDINLSVQMHALENLTLVYILFSC